VTEAVLGAGRLAAPAESVVLLERFARAEEGLVLIESPCGWQSIELKSLFESTGTE
jgi:hypothetical protein